MAHVKVTVTGDDKVANSTVGQMVLGMLRTSGFQSGITDPEPNQTVGVGKVAYNTIVAVEVINPKVEKKAEPLSDKDIAALKAMVEDLKSQIKSQVKSDFAPGTDSPKTDDLLHRQENQLDPKTGQLVTPDLTGEQ